MACPVIDGCRLEIDNNHFRPKTEQIIIIGVQCASDQGAARKNNVFDIILLYAFTMYIINYNIIINFGYDKSRRII